ncbi:unnamed protein product, partial [Hapterophycus canaliculatus]
DPRFSSFVGENGENIGSLLRTVQSSLRLNPEISGGRGSQALVTSLSFQHSNPELCEQSVKAFSDSIQEFFREKHKSSRSEVLRLITLATDQLQPRIEQLEKRYREFRTTAPLVWNDEGIATNPHRERQFYLTLSPMNANG